MSQDIYQGYKIFPVADAQDLELGCDIRYRVNTVTFQALNLDPSEVVDGKLVNEKLLNILDDETKITAATAGTLTLKAVPPRSRVKYDIPNGTIQATDLSFLTTDSPVETFYLDLAGVTGCSHILVSVTGYQY